MSHGVGCRGATETALTTSGHSREEPERLRKRGGGLRDFRESFIVWLVMRRAVDWFPLLALAVLTLGFAACTFGKSEENATSGPAATSTATAASQRAFVRTCEMSVYGTLDAPAWEKHSIVAGPLVF
jgi:hypothetical protein